MSNKDEQARILAEKHYEVEPGITGIYRLVSAPSVESEPNEPIKLLEVNEDTVPSGVMPIGFGPAPYLGITHGSTIVEVTPAEFEKIRNNQLPLPQGWQLGDLLPPPVARNGK